VSGVEEAVCYGSHVKRVMTRSDDTDVGGTFVVSFNREVQSTTDSCCVNLFKEFETARANAQNLSNSLKVNEFADFDNQRVYVPVLRAISPTMCEVT